MSSPIASSISNFEIRISDFRHGVTTRVDLGGLPALWRRGFEFSILSSQFLIPDGRAWFRKRAAVDVMICWVIRRGFGADQ